MSTTDLKPFAQEKASDKKTVLLENGLKLEGYGPGGVTEEVSTDQILFWRDIKPFYLAVEVIIIIHTFYYLTGNMCVILFITQAKQLYDYFADKDKYYDTQNISRTSERAFMADKRFHYPMWATFAAGTFTWIWVLCLFSDDVKFNSYYLTTVKPVTFPQLIVFWFVIGFISAVETQAGHELIHRRETHNKILGMLSNAKIFYSHFKDEHVQGHHKKLSTPEDPSTSRMNESFYEYVPREVFGTHKSMWQRECRKIKQQHGSDCSILAIILFNRMTWYFVLHVSICVTVYLTLGLASLKTHFVYGIIGLLYQCFANYITHYGLLRSKDKNKIYESISKYHSWNFVSSPILFRLPRHSDHHICSFRPYQILRRFDDAPYNHFQFTICFYLVLVPPIWFYIMNPRAQAANDFTRGIKNTYSSFNNMQVPTEFDIKSLRIGYVFFALITVYIGYFAFFSDATSVLKNQDLSMVI